MDTPIPSSVIDFELACDRCGAGLRGLPWEGACSECGQSVGGTLYLPATHPVSRTVLGDLPCVGCEYNLRTLHASGRCPECGRPVAESLSCKRSCFAHPDWVDSLVRGCNLTLWVLVWLPVGLIASVLFLPTVFVAVPVGIVLLCWAWPTGVFLLLGSPPDSGTLDTRKHIYRSPFIAMMIMVLMLFMTPFAPKSGFIFVIFFFLGSLCLGHGLQALFLRMGDRKSAVRSWDWLLAAAFWIAIVCVTLGILLWPSRFHKVTSSSIYYAVVMIEAGIGGVIYLALIGLLLRLRRHLKRVAAFQAIRMGRQGRDHVVAGVPAAEGEVNGEREPRSDD